MSADTTYVAVSGNADTDTAAIQSAIDSFTHTSSTLRQGAVALNGHYYINAPLTVDTIPATERCVPIIGAPWATLEWVGDTTESYMLRMSGTGRTAVTRLGNLHFLCHHKCRGAHVHYQSYSSRLENLVFEDTRQVGLESHANWGSCMYNLRFVGCRGIAMRLTNFNSCYIEGLTFERCKAIYHVTDSTLDRTLGKYEMANGSAAAITHYGAHYGTDWPAVDEETVPTYAGGYVQTAATTRGICLMGGANSYIGGVRFIDCVSGEYPLLRPMGTGTTYHAMSLQGNLAKVKLAQSALVHTVFDGVQTDDVELPATDETLATCFLHLQGNGTLAASGMNAVRNFYGNGYKDCIMLQDGDGVFYGNVVERAGTWDNEIAAANWKTTAEGSTNNDAVYVGRFL